MKSGWHWPLILAGLMAIALIANFTLLFLATSDPSFAVEADYYDKATHWDDKRAQDARNERLGWSLALDVGTTADAVGNRTLRVTLADDDGAPLPDATVDVEAFHNARAAAVLDGELRAIGDGVYEIALPVRRPGVWEFRFVAERGGERFTRAVQRDVAPAR